MIVNDIDSTNESTKIINLIKKEFSQLSSTVLINQLKSISNKDDKQLRLFAAQSFQLYEKAKDSSIEKIAQYFNKKYNRTSLHNQWLNIIHKNDTNTTHSNESQNVQLRLSSVKSMNTTLKRRNVDKDKSLYPNLTEFTPNNRSSFISTISKSKSSNFIFNKNTLSTNDRFPLNTKAKTNSSVLAQSVINFIDKMKQLQDSIINKKKNVSELKKSFEQKKSKLYNEALKSCNINKSNNYNISLISNGDKETNVNETINGEALKESISLLQRSIEDLKSHNKYITDQLRNEINQLTEENNNYKAQLNENMKTINKQKTSIIELYINLINNHQNTNEMSIRNYDWYINAIKTEINRRLSNNHCNNNESDILIKIHKMIKLTSQDIISMINPYLEGESEIDFDSLKVKSDFEEEIMLSSIERLKMYIKSIIATLINYKSDKETLTQLLNECETKAETYKSALDQTVIRMTKNENERGIYTDNNNNFNNFDTDLLNIQSDLLKKLEFNDIEFAKQQEELKTLLQLNTNSKDNEKYSFVLGLYIREQEKGKRLKSEYLHLIQDFGNYIENGKKALIDINKLTENFGSNNAIEQMGDQYSMKGDIMDDMNKIGLNDKELIVELKLKLDEAYDLINRLEDKVNDNNRLYEVIGNKLEKIVMEINLNKRIKEIIRFIFKLINYSDSKIESIFIEYKKMNKK